MMFIQRCLLMFKGINGTLIYFKSQTDTSFQHSNSITLIYASSFVAFLQLRNSDIWFYNDFRARWA